MMNWNGRRSAWPRSVLDAVRIFSAGTEENYEDCCYLLTALKSNPEFTAWKSQERQLRVTFWHSGRYVKVTFQCYAFSLSHEGIFGLGWAAL